MTSKSKRRAKSRQSPSSALDRMKISRVVGAAHERTRGHVLESLLARNLAVKLELLRRDVFNHRQMIRCRPQILAHRQNLATNFTQIIHRLKNLGLSFAQTEHDSALRYRFRRKSFRAPQNLQRHSV